jgi:class 3 adenylate cyclase/tRNA A-37 threonylcarbamoyl transferase component Bud32
MPTAPSPLSGSVFDGQYEIVGELGAGTFGRVYRATQRSTGQLVALKIVRGWTDDAQTSSGIVRQRFHREMRLCAELSHPNIVRLLDSGEDADGTLYAAFEYITGHTLQRLLEEEGRLALPEAVHLMTQALDALACAHRRGVVHRDLKPANIMVTHTGARRNAMVLDFGLGGFAEGHRDWASPRITMTREMMGTPGYAAPEQLRGEPTTTRSDLYSWGLVFLECLTGEPVVRGATVHQVLHQQLGPEPIAVPDWLADQSLGGLLACVTSKDPDARSKSIPELMAQLDRVLLDARGAGDAATSAPRVAARSALPRPAGGQQRPVTGLSCRLSAHVVGSAPVAVEALDAALWDARARCLEQIDRLGGVTVGALGGSFQIAFGYPRAEEDAPRRAVRAALEVIDTIGRCSRDAESRGIALVARVGVHTGLVVARIADASPSAAADLCGTTLDAASHLDAAANPNEVLLSASTYELLRGALDGEPGPPVLLPGASAPVPAFRLTGRQDAFRRGRTGTTATPFVGRGDELESLRRAWERARAGKPESVVVMGDAGMGKSRLIHELRRTVEAGTWLECRCTPEAQTSPLRPFVEALG